jgi:hypothetical protein
MGLLFLAYFKLIGILLCIDIIFRVLILVGYPHGLSQVVSLGFG